MNDLLPYFVAGFTIVLTIVLIINLRRAKRFERQNAKLAETQKTSIALQDRQVAALERIATALERRNG